MKIILTLMAITLATGRLLADDITTLDGKKYTDVKDVSLKPNGLFFVAGSGDSEQGVTVPYDNLPDDVKKNIITIPTKRASPLLAKMHGFL